MAGDSILWMLLKSSTGINMIYSPENMKLMNWKQKVLFGVLYYTLKNLSCFFGWPKIVSRIFLMGGKSASFLFISSFKQWNRNSEGSGKKLEIPEGRRG